MQALYKKEWLEHRQQDDVWARPSVWPATANPLFLSGTGLHRLSENSAEKYWDARDNQNVQKIDDPETNTIFYVLRAACTKDRHGGTGSRQCQHQRRQVHRGFDESSEHGARGSFVVCWHHREVLQRHLEAQCNQPESFIPVSLRRDAG